MSFVRRADFLHAGRVRAWLTIAAVVTVAAVVGGLAVARGGVDPMGRPLGTDFLAFWTAARVAIADGAAAAWDGMRLQAEQVATFGPRDEYTAFFYPPAFLLIVWPLGLLPYLVALVLWLVVTGVAAWRALVGLARSAFDERTAAIAFLAYPATFAEIGHGQNAFLSTALLAAGARFAVDRPILAGALLGGLVFKPQLAIALPVALAAVGAWRLFVATGAFAAVWCAAAWLVFGTEAWVAFLEMSKVARATLDLGLVEPGKMVSVHAAIRVWGGSAEAAAIGQGLVAIAVGTGLWVAARRGRSAEAAVVLASIAAVLMSPFVLDYDLMILAVAMVVLVRDGVRHGFGDFEAITLFAVFCLPSVARPLATGAHVAIAPLVVAALFVVAARATIRPDRPTPVRACLRLGCPEQVGPS